MEQYEGPVEAAEAIKVWLYMNPAPVAPHIDDRLAALKQPGTSPVDVIMTFVEAVYANRDLFEGDARSIAAGASLFAEYFNYFGMAIDSRGSKIARVLAEIEPLPDPEPEPKADFLPRDEDDGEP